MLTVWNPNPVSRVVFELLVGQTFAGVLNIKTSVNKQIVAKQEAQKVRRPCMRLAQCVLSVACMPGPLGAALLLVYAAVQCRTGEGPDIVVAEKVHTFPC